jgi:hypothetical protein
MEHWYFIEISWSLHYGLEVFADQKFVCNASMATSRKSLMNSNDNRLYIGRSRTPANRGSSINDVAPNIILDDIKICYGDRQNLIEFGFIQSGELVVRTFYVLLLLQIFQRACYTETD